MKIFKKKGIMQLGLLSRNMPTIPYLSNTSLLWTVCSCFEEKHTFFAFIWVIDIVDRLTSCMFKKSWPNLWSNFCPYFEKEHAFLTPFEFVCLNIVFILDGRSFHYAHIGVNQAFRFVEGIWLHRKSRQIRKSSRKRPILHYTYAARAGIPSKISTMVCLTI